MTSNTTLEPEHQLRVIIAEDKGKHNSLELSLIYNKTFPPLIYTGMTVSKISTFRDSKPDCLHRTVQTAVYRGTLRQDSTTRKVVCKLAQGEGLEHLTKEAGIYTGKLCTLQGTDIPTFYGFFEGTGSDGERWACMILEDCGEAVKEKEGLAWDLTRKERVMNIMVKIHDHGVEHGDFAWKNIVSLGKDIRVIDFDRAKFRHCTRDMDINPGNWNPIDARFGCEELLRVGRTLEIWVPWEFCIGKDCWASIFMGPTTAEMVACLQDRYVGFGRSFDTKEALEAAADKAITKYRGRFEKHFARIGDPANPNDLKLKQYKILAGFTF